MGAIALALVAAAVAGSMVYCAMVVVAAARLPRRGILSKTGVPMSIVKPLSGADADLKGNLRSFFALGYPEFEILCAVRREDDAAVAVVEQLQREFPAVRSRLLITGEPPYPNAKVYALQHLIAAARFDVLVMSDSDIRVAPDFLDSIAAEFEDPAVDLLTCLYRAVGGPGLWSRLEALGMNTEFWGGVVVARMLEGMRFAVGPTTAARRTAIDGIGGIESLRDYLAEDFVLGKHAAEAGFGVILSRIVVEHRIGDERFVANAAHRLRWARGTRRSRPGGYVGQVFTNPVPLALAMWALAPGWWPLALVALGLRAVAAWAVAGPLLGARIHWLLLPVQDLLSYGFWVAGFFGNHITWRGRRYMLNRDGTFQVVGTL